MKHGKYVCSKCGATGCKLWREYQDTTLLCAPCAADIGGKDISDLDADGTRLSETEGLRENGVRTDQIGWYVPAVPEDGETGVKLCVYWGYTSCPQTDYDWWKALPSLP